MKKNAEINKKYEKTNLIKNNNPFSVIESIHNNFIII